MIVDSTFGHMKKYNKRFVLALRILATISAIAVVLCSSEYIFGLLATTLSINTSGVVTSADLEAYWDSDCTNTVSSINWGTIYPGESKNVTIYIKNTGNVPLTLSLLTDNWNPSEAESYLTLSWNYNGEHLQADETLPVTLTLVVSSNTQGITNFSFNIIITGTEVQS